METNKKNLIIISSKNPNDTLIQNIESLILIYPKNDIVIVDSDSTNFETYDLIKEKYNDKVQILFLKNKNYEYGAYKMAYELYPDYAYYMCIQDTLIPTKKIDLENLNENDVYLILNNTGFNNHKNIKDVAISLIDNTIYEKYMTQIINDNFVIAENCSFILTNDTLKNIINTMPKLPIDKNGSCSYERIFGIYFLFHKMNIIDMKLFFNKIFRRRL